MDLPYELFIGFIVISIVMSIAGLIAKKPFLMFIGGAFIAFWVIMTDNFIMGIKPESSTTIGDTTTYVMKDIVIPIEAWAKILLGLFGAIFSIVGALMWKEME